MLGNKKGNGGGQTKPRRKIVTSIPSVYQPQQYTYISSDKRITTDSSYGSQPMSSGRRRGVLADIISATSVFNNNNHKQIAQKVVSNKFFKDDGEGNLNVDQLWSNYQKDDGTGSVNNIKAKLNAIATKIDILLNGALKDVVSHRDTLLTDTKDLRLMQLQFAYKDGRGQTQEHEKKKVLRQARRLGLYDKNNDDETNFHSLTQEKDRAKVNMIQTLNTMFEKQLREQYKSGVSIKNIEDIFFAKGFNTVETARNTNFRVELSDGSWMYCGISDNGVRAMLSCERYINKISKIHKALQAGEQGVQDGNQNKKFYEQLVDIERHIGNVTCGNPRDAQEKAISLRSLNQSVRPKVVLDAEAPEWGTTACLTTAYDSMQGLQYKEVAKMPEFDKEEKQHPYNTKFETCKQSLDCKLNERIADFRQEKFKTELQNRLYDIAKKMAKAFQVPEKMPGVPWNPSNKLSVMSGSDTAKKVVEAFSNQSSNKSSLISTESVNKKLETLFKSLNYDLFGAKDDKNKLKIASDALKDCFENIGKPDTEDKIQEIINSKEQELHKLALAANTSEVEQLKNDKNKLKNSNDSENMETKTRIAKLDKQIKEILRKLLPGEKLKREIMELTKYKETLADTNKENINDDNIRRELNIPYVELMKLRDSAIQVFQKTGTGKMNRTAEHNRFIVSVMELLHHSMIKKGKDDAETYKNIRCEAEKYAKIKKDSAYMGDEKEIQAKIETELAEYAVINIGKKSTKDGGIPFTISSGKVLMNPVGAVMLPMQEAYDTYKGLRYQLEDEYNAKLESIEKGRFETKNIKEWFVIKEGEGEVSEGDKRLMQFTIDSLVTADYKPDNLGRIQGQGQWQGLVTFDVNIPTTGNENGAKFIKGMTQDTEKMQSVVQSANESPHNFYKAKVGLITQLENAYQRFDAFKDVIGQEHAYKAMIQTLTERMKFLQGQHPETYLAFVQEFSETIQRKITSNTEYIQRLRQENRSNETSEAKETKKAISDSLQEYGQYLTQLKSLVSIGNGQEHQMAKTVEKAENTMLVDAKKYNNEITALVIEEVDDRGFYVFNAIGVEGGKYYYPFNVEGSELIAKKSGKGFGLFSKGDPFAPVQNNLNHINLAEHNTISVQEAHQRIAQAEKQSIEISAKLAQFKEQNRELERWLNLGANGDDSYVDEEIPDAAEKMPEYLSKAIESAKQQIEQYADINQQLQVNEDFGNFVINKQAINKLQQEIERYQGELQLEKKKLEETKKIHKKMEDDRQQRERAEEERRRKEAIEEKERLQQQIEAEAILFAQEQERIEREAEIAKAEEIKKIQEEQKKKLQEMQKQALLLEEQRRLLEEKKRQEAERLKELQQQKEENDRRAKIQRKLLEFQRQEALKNAKLIKQLEDKQEEKIRAEQAKLQQIKQKIYDHQGEVSVLKSEQGKVYDAQYRPVDGGIDDAVQLYTMKREPKVDVRFEQNQNHHKIIQAMTDALQEAIKKTKEALESIAVDIKIDKEFVQSVIDFAQKNNGVKERYHDQEDKYNHKDYKLAAQQLSYQYQQAASESQLLTGKKNPQEFVGARLKRIPTKYIKDIVDNALDTSI